MPVQPKVLPFGQWEPDKADLEISDGVTIARNCVPSASGYGPFKEFSVETDELNERPLGAILSRDVDGAVFQYAGDASRLYQNVANAWTDVSLFAGTAIELTGVGTNLGDMTGGGGLAAAFDDDTTQAAAACAAEAASTASWVGKTLPTAKAIHQVVVHGSNDAGFVSAINPNVTLTLYGKNGTAPATATDGTVIGTLAAFADTADESAGRTITASDRDTVWDHVWISITHDGAANQINVAELVIHEADRYDTADAEVWEFARWQNTVIATNYTNDPQVITLGASNFANLTTDVKFKHIAVVRDFVVAGYTSDGVDGPVPWRVRWCAFKDPTDWTVDPATLCDYEDLSQREIKRIFGGEYGVILQDEAIVRMTFVGAPLVFQFDEVVPNLGLLASGLAARSADTIFFLSTKGFFSLTNGTNVAPIGHEKVDATVLTDIDLTSLHRCSSVTDPKSHRVYFGYPGGGNADGLPNKILCYDPSRDRFSEILVEFELLWEAAGAATTLEDLDTLYGDLDAMDVSLDSSRWIGGSNAVAAFDSLYMSGFFDGANMDASIETREYAFDAAQRTRVHGFRPYVEGDNFEITGKIGTRSDIADDVTYSSLLTPNTGGRICCRANGRYHRFVVNISGQWTQAFGVLVEQRDLGYGGRRG
jgi:hypothetical protein